MSSYAEQFRHHPVWASLKALGPAIDESIRRDAVTSDTIENLERLRTVLAFAGKRLAGADPLLTILAPLDEINSRLANAQAELTAFVSDGDVAHIAASNLHADAVLAALRDVPVSFTPDETGALKDAAIAYRQTMTSELDEFAKRLRAIDQQATATAETLQGLITTTNAEREIVAAAVSEMQSQFAATQDSRQAAFTVIQTHHAEKVALFNTQLATHQQEAVARYEKQLGELKQSWDTSAKEFLDAIEEKKLEVEKVAGVVGNLALTSGHLQTADFARGATKTWHIVTVLSFVALIAFALYIFFFKSEANVSWPGFATRVFFTVTVSVFTAYAARQADKYLDMDRRNRKLALELEALGPFLAPLPEDSQNEFRLKVGELSFGRDDDGLKASDRSPATLVHVLAEAGVIEQIAKATATNVRKIILPDVIKAAVDAAKRTEAN